MTSVEAVVDVAAPAERVWAALVDWPTHGDWLPLTTVRVTSQRPDGVGASFVARTGVGPLAFDDPMVVTEWQPPARGRRGRCVVRKTGRVLLGSATLEVDPLGPRRSLVVWREDVEVAPRALGRCLAPVIRAGGRPALRVALGRLVRQIEAGRLPTST